MATRKKNSAAKTTHAQAAPETALPRLDGRTPKEAADNLRKEARRIENYRHRPEVRWTIARDPKILAMVVDLERSAAALRESADALEAACGDMNATEFAALNAQADAWAELHPEQAEQARRDVGRMSVAGECQDGNETRRLR